MNLEKMIWLEGSIWYGAVANDYGIIRLVWDYNHGLTLWMLSEYRVEVGSKRARKHLDRLRKELGEYDKGTRKKFTVPIAPRGTEFQQRVWKAVGEVPFGKSATYGDIARTVGNPKGTRAVGQALGSNQVAIVVPCHRILASGNNLGGFSGDLNEKRRLLRHERIDWNE